MVNIPTELLRTLVAVVDHRSYTRAAQSLGITQPAVSAQIKRLQVLLGIEVFDRQAAGVSLTAAGDTIVAYARRMLSINDQILQVTAPVPAPRMLRLGMTGDYVAPVLANALADYRRRRPYTRFQLITDLNERLLHDLRTGALDLVVLLTMDKAEFDARHHWTEDMVWARGAAMAIDPALPVPLLTRGAHWMNHRLAVEALDRVGRSYEVVFTGPSILSLVSAARAGLGIMPFSRRRVAQTDLVICDTDELPELPDLVCSVYVSETGEADLLKDLADMIAATIRPTGKTRTPPERDPIRMVLTDLIAPQQM
jgi:DNA-binding transcriptional LysR family regulator